MTGKLRDNAPDVVDFLYVLAFLAAFLVWNKSGSYRMAMVSFMVILVMLAAGIQLYKSWREQKLLDSGIDIVDKMSGTEFAEFLLAHFKNVGYSGYLTSTEDYGAVLFLEKSGKKLVVQAKRWKQIVGVEAVQQILGAIRHFDAYMGMVITNNAFTENAHILADASGIELWDRQTLTRVMYESKGLALASAVIARSEYNQAVAEAAVALEESCPGAEEPGERV